MSSAVRARRSILSRQVWLSFALTLLLFTAGQVAFRLLAHERPDCCELEYGRKVLRLRARLAEKSGHPLVLVLGSSRPAVGFRPRALPELPDDPVVFNFAQSGSGPIHNGLWLHRLLAQGIRPDWIILETWPPFWQLYSKSEDVLTLANLGSLSWDEVQHLRPYAAAPRKLCADWLENQLAPMVANRGPLLRSFLPQWLPPAPHDVTCMDLIDHDGWRPSGLAHDPNHYERMKADYAQAFAFLKQFMIPPASARALRDMLAVCRAEGIRPLLLLMPESRDFQAWYPPAARVEFERFLRSLSRAQGVPLIDARAWMPKEAYSDPAHLHVPGATAFTQRFGRDILLPLMRGEPARPAGPSDEPAIIVRSE